MRVIHHVLGRPRRGICCVRCHGRFVGHVDRRYVFSIVSARDAVCLDGDSCESAAKRELKRAVYQYIKALI